MSHISHSVVRDVQRILVRRAPSHRELESCLEFFIVFLQTVVGVVKHQLHQGGIDIVGLSKAVAMASPKLRELKLFRTKTGGSKLT